jgi:hypothetical protein
MWSFLERLLGRRGENAPRSERSVSRTAQQPDAYPRDPDVSEHGDAAAPTEEYPRDLTEPRSTPAKGAADDYPRDLT